jgi:hypothetical protein
MDIVDNDDDDDDDCWCFAQIGIFLILSRFSEDLIDNIKMAWIHEHTISAHHFC